MAVSLSPFAGAGWQFFDNNGVILSGGKLYVYAAGTTSLATTYISSTGSTANTNPIILNSSGRLANEIWLTVGLNYKFILKDATDVLIGTWDNIPAGTTDVADLQAALASSTGAGMIGYIQGGTAVATTVQTKLRETVSVFDFMTAAQIADVQAGTASIDVTVAIQAAINASDQVFIPEGTYLITGSGITLTAGKTIIGVKGSETGTAYATTGTIFVGSGTTTRFIFLSKGAVSCDRATVQNIAIKGNNEDYGIYSDGSRQCTFQGLMFNNLKTCIHLETANWMNVFDDIKAFNFDKFCYMNSGGEDSAFYHVIARSYRTGSAGIYVNYYGQTLYLENCDLSECQSGYVAAISLGSHTVLFNSCYFEMSNVSTGAAATFSTSTQIMASFNNCRFFDKSSPTITTYAFSGAGAGSISISSNNCYFAEIDVIAYDVSGSSIKTIQGDNNYCTHSTSYSLYSGVKNYSRKFGLIGVAEGKNLGSIGKQYATVFSFNSNTVTLTIASPCVITWNAHGLNNGDAVIFSTTGSLPTGLATATIYYVVNKTINNFQVSATSGGTAINTSGSQSGTHTASKAFTLDFNQGGASTGIYQINITTDNAPSNLTTIMYQPKSYFSNGVATEITDVSGTFSEVVAGDTLAIAKSSTTDCQIIVQKIS